MVKEFQMKMWFDVLEGDHFILTHFWMKVYANAIIKKIRFEREEKYTDYKIEATLSSGS